MIKRISMLVFACLLVASLSFAATTPKPASTKSEATKSASAQAMMKVSGTIEKIDAKTHTLSINTGTETKSFTFGIKTVYMQGTKKVKSTTLKEGDKVDVYPDSKNMIHKLEIEPATPTTH